MIRVTRVKVLESYRPEFKSRLASYVTYTGFLTSLGYRFLILYSEGNKTYLKVL